MHNLFGIRKENLKSKQRKGERTMFKALGMGKEHLNSDKGGRTMYKALGVDVEAAGTTTYEEWAIMKRDFTYEGMIRDHAGFQGNRNAVKQNHYSTSRNPSNVRDPVYDAMIDRLNAVTTYEEERKLTREADMYGIEQHWTIWGPMAMSANVNQPWIIGFNGENPY